MQYTDKTNLIEILKEFNISQKESEIYLSLLRLGTNPASTLARQSNLKRTSCYTALNKLTQKGFVQKTTKNNITYFHAIQPNIILQKITQKKTQLEKKIINFNTTIKNIQSLKENYKKNSTVVFFNNTENIKNLIQLPLINKTTEIKMYGCIKELTYLPEQYTKQYLKTLEQKNIKLRIICRQTIKTKKHKKEDIKKLRETKLIKQKKSLNIIAFNYNNKIGIILTKEKFGILITSKPLTEAISTLFNFTWK